MDAAMKQWIAVGTLLSAVALWFFTLQQTPAKPGQLDSYIPYGSSSYERFHQPHATWLVKDQHVGDNLGRVHEVLAFAGQQKRRPEFVIYFIPERDLGESSEGGFEKYKDYYEENWLIKEAIKAFVKGTGIRPRVYLEPDALAHAITFRQQRNNDPRSQRIYYDRVAAMKELVTWYRDAGAYVYLDAAHGQWINNDTAQQVLADTLVAAGYKEASGLTSNVSNRNPLTDKPDAEAALNEATYLELLLKKLPWGRKDIIVDTSRNGGQGFLPRQYFLAPDGKIYDNEMPEGRWVGNWNYTQDGELRFFPFFGGGKSISRLMNREKYQFDTKQRLLTAPLWLDPIGDVKLGPPPSDQGVRGTPIDKLRYIKPPDECDGSLSCPPGHSKQAIKEQLTALQQTLTMPKPAMPWKKP